MNLKLLFFASLREQFGFSQKEIALSRTVKSPEEFLLIMSKESGGEWINLFNNKKLYKVAINKDLASWSHLIVEGDELAIFPPITGG
ncbi:MAG: MoaD/ThiS family protein [Nitrosomonadales bacterium]|jgi:molybdopterin synthase sulfur carrier subunit|nr:MoaD/ThiS family protein [Nitrosomonadales bacterium]MBT6015082.1 MoaD/ThiS family protein [Nitrosomonadales bacterium]MBT6251462.1 MoaD/ThiS family protein [Nitrosomonadales bacterium]MBT6818042.1 MoaD/ThiS family protein [Nitrosomonadales bacterium]MBT7407339.1 MoaD/ThiS family protein [Nitrosomonadales bacterium]